jgi:hypothetical protein
MIADRDPVPHPTHQHGFFFAWRQARFEWEFFNLWEHEDATVRHDKVLFFL